MHSVAKNMSTMINFHIIGMTLASENPKAVPKTIFDTKSIWAHTTTTNSVCEATSLSWKCDTFNTRPYCTPFFILPDLNFCSSGGELDHQIRHLGRAIEHNFGPEQGARIWTSQPSKVQMPGGCPGEWDGEASNWSTHKCVKTTKKNINKSVEWSHKYSQPYSHNKLILNNVQLTNVP